MSVLEETLRATARNTLDIADGEYFDSMVFTNQAKAVRELLARLYEESYGDFDYVLLALTR